MIHFYSFLLQNGDGKNYDLVNGFVISGFDGILRCFLFLKLQKRVSFYEKHKKGIFYCAAACIVLLACAMMLSAVQTGLPFRVKNLPAACLICGLVFFLLALFRNNDYNAALAARITVCLACCRPNGYA